MASKIYRVYLRISKGGRVEASKRPKFQSFDKLGYKGKRYSPTIIIALDLEIDGKEFDAAKILLKQKIEASKPCVEIRQVVNEGDTVDEM